MSNDKTESISAKLRRWADDSDTYESPSHCIASKELCIDCPNIPCLKCENELFNRIADEIDAEKRAIYEAQMDSTGYGTSPHHIIKAYAESIGKPMNGDCITDWLNRFYITRPLFDDGEPLVPGDEIDFHGRDEMVISYVVNSNRKDDYSPYATLHLKCGASHNVPISERLRRPKKQVLDADGVPIEVGNAVYPNYGTYANRKSTVLDVCGQDDVIVSINGGGFERFNGKYLTHREPDTQERIDRDALKDVHGYWGCVGVDCSQCPALVDGKKPKKRYGVIFCSDAMRLDLLRRQRELDGRDA